MNEKINCPPGGVFAPKQTELGLIPKKRMQADGLESCSFNLRPVPADVPGCQALPDILPNSTGRHLKPGKPERRKLAQLRLVFKLRQRDVAN